MAERQQQHRQELEREILRSNIVARSRGQFFGFFIGLMGIMGGIVLVGLDKPITGLSTFFTTLGVLVYEIAYGRKKKEKNIQAENPK